MVDAELLETQDAGAMHQDRNAELIYLLNLAMVHCTGESAVDDFVIELFRNLGYTRRTHVARTRVDLTLLICGEYRQAKTDVCLVEHSGNDILLLVQEDKRIVGRGPVDVYAQLVAEAIAVFDENNNSRIELGQQPLEKKIMPGIVMLGTLPACFKIPVTQNLVNHIRYGTYPPIATNVTYCLPLPIHRRREGMKPIENRRIILSHYEAFKNVVGI